MKQWCIIFAVFCATTLRAQSPEEALRTAWFGHNGTARFMGTGV